MSEKHIEKAIINYLKSKGAVVEGIQSGSVMIKKGSYNNKMILQSAGCPDILAYYNGVFIGIEVKKDQKEVDAWIKKEQRVNNGEELPKSYKREKDQIEYKKKILENGGYHTVTCDVSEIITFIENIKT